MTRHAILALVLVTAACGHSTPAPTLSASDQKLGAELDALVTARIKDQPMAGLSVAVLKGDQPLLVRGYGLADVEHQVKVSPTTIFRIGSQTKSFTAAEIVTLEQAGKLAAGDPLGKYLPEYPLEGKPVTLYHLLTHTSGIHNYTDLPEFKSKMNEPMSRPDFVAWFGKAGFDFEPGSDWSYSNSGYYLLGLVIEKVTGRSYEAAVQTVIHAAGLEHTAYCPPDMSAPGYAHGYELAGDEPAPAPPLDMAHPYAAGALCSTALDMAHWLRALAGGKVVGVDGWKAMTTTARIGERDTHYGLGLIVGRLGDHLRVQHGGGINGFISAMAIYPDDDLTVVVLSNGESELGPTLAVELARKVLGVPEPAVKDEAMDPSLASRLEGTYTFAEMPITVAVRLHDGKIEVANLDEHGQPQRWLPVHYQGGNRFEAPEINAHLEFVLPEGDGPASTLVVEQGGVTLHGTRKP